MKRSKGGNMSKETDTNVKLVAKEIDNKRIKWTEEEIHKRLASHISATLVMGSGRKSINQLKSLKSSWQNDLVTFFELLLTVILSILKGEVYNIDQTVDFLTNMWMKYCDIGFIPNMIEKPIVKIIIRALTQALINLIGKGIISKSAINIGIGWLK